MIKIGILGAARIAHMAIINPVALREDCKITAVACSNLSRGEAFAKLHHIPSVETSYEALITREDVNLIYNALPPSRHADLSIAAVEAGKTVLCEKPFAMNAIEAERIVNASKKTGLPIIEAFHYRFHPAFLHMQNIIDNGEIGHVQEIQAIFNAPIPYSKEEIRYGFDIGGGALMDLGCYCLHWARLIADNEPTVVNAQCVIHPSGVDLATQAELMFDNKIKANISCSMDEKTSKKIELTIKGSKGKIIFTNPLHPHKGYQMLVQTQTATRIEDKVYEKTTYDFQLDHVVDVMKGNISPIGGQSDAVANMAAIDAIYQAANLPER